MTRKQRDQENYWPRPTTPSATLLLPSRHLLGAGLQAAAPSLTTTDLRISVVMDGSTRSS